MRAMKDEDQGSSRSSDGKGHSKGTRWLAPWKDSTEKPVIYHCVTRVVDRRFAFEKEDKEKLRTFMRMQENFTGCRVLAYCLMSNHVHILLEVPPLPAGGFTDAELLARLRASCNEAEVAMVAKRLAEYRKCGATELARELHESYTYRMHDLGEFMKTLLQRFTRWYNVKHERTGTLWESRFKSVLVEDGIASRTMAAYIDLNPVRAGMVVDPAEYRWSSYGEAMGGGPRGNGKKARAGLVRALMAHKGYEADARHWAGKVSKDYRMLLLDEGEEKLREVSGADGGIEVKVVRKGMKKEAVEAELELLERSRDVAMRKMLHCRVRYFTDGAVLGSREFVDGVFRACRDRFGDKRRSGARKLRGSGAAATGLLWSVRDLQKGIG
jgi:REP element-mobilizing transposase RayT